jgi:uncharacterized protein (TIGR02145 family)
MQTKIFLTVTALFLIICAFSQNPTLELTFTAINSAAHVQLDSIKVINRTQGGDTILYWPDTVLVLDYHVGIHEVSNDSGNLQVFQNYPNPVTDQTTIPIYVPDKDNVSMIITDILGRVIFKSNTVLDKGHHSFRFAPGGGNLYFLTAIFRGNSSSIKILHAISNSNKASSLEYMGRESLSPQLKATEKIQRFLFNLGDELLYIGNIDTAQSGMLDKPETSQIYIFQFVTNIPCSGTPTVEYEGQIYNTIQIFSQCWLKENLNVGTMIPGNQEMASNGIIEKYCYNNNSNYCDQYGGLYQWNEMMQYLTQKGAQGICPDGWHIPTDDEIKVLEGAVDSQYCIGNPEWDGWDFRGLDIGYRIKSINGWTGGAGIDSHGFTLLPAGARFTNGSFIHYTNHAYIWSSSEHTGNYAWNRLIYTFNESLRNSFQQEYGFSVRCVRDYVCTEAHSGCKGTLH